MKRLAARILITGGSGAGKSTFAETLALRLPAPHTYLATMRVFGREDREKVGRHKAIRKGKGFITLEREIDIAGAHLCGGGTVLLECMCNLAANEMFDERGGIHDAYEPVISGIAALERKCDALIVVTNDVGSDGGGYSESTMRYVDVLGRLNRTLAARFECVCELVCGIPLLLKGELP